jgi:hypothetical protein
VASQHDDEDESERPITTVDVDDITKFRLFLLDLAVGYKQAKGDPRVDTALRYFDRTCDRLFAVEQYHMDTLEEETLEDLVADACTSLEAALLTGRSEARKGERLAERTAALVAADDTERATVYAEVKSDYDLRNAIVHGDARQPKATLAAAARSLRVRTRQVLVALLLLRGDRQSFRIAVGDAAERAKLHTHLRRYVETR